MRIAIYEPDPRVCGPLSWGGHLRHGFEELGHEVKTVTSTKSGRRRSSWGTPKWGGHWWSTAPDLVVKDDKVSETLDQFDLIVLPEPRSPAEDKLAVKQHRWPTYYLGLWGTQTKFVTALHGNDYDAKTAPFMEHLLALPNFTGRLLSHSDRSLRSNPLFDTIEHFSTPLPYRPVNDISTPVLANPTVVGTTGRFMFNKGSHMLAFAAKHLPADTTVEIWGSASTGLGTNVTYAVYEALLEEAENFIRYGDQEEKAGTGYEKLTAHGNTIRPYTWDIRLKTGQLVRYLGNYTDPVGIASRLGVHVNLTGVRYSGGLVEYSTLEAMDAGSICITPTHVSDKKYLTMQLDMDNPPGSVISARKAPELVKRIGDTVASVQGFLADPLYEDWRRDVIEHNRSELRFLSDPANIAKQIIEESL